MIGIELDAMTQFYGDSLGAARSTAMTYLNLSQSQLDMYAGQYGIDSASVLDLDTAAYLMAQAALTANGKDPAQIRRMEPS